jgi:indolepyruvate ferredoxin oxidoreductase alpha subunit
MVIVVADDPSLHSSQNEQDNRYYAKMAGVPMLEPSTPEEAREMTIRAFEISEKHQIPCILRTTTRVNHCRGPVGLGELPTEKPAARFEKDPFNLVVVPMVGRKLRLALLEKLERMREEADKSPFNVVSGSGSWGIVTSGVSYLYVRDAVRDLGIEDRVRILKLGFSFPHPKAVLQSFIEGLEKVLVVEELEPFQEETLRVVAQEAGSFVLVGGKGKDLIPQAFELDGVQVKRGMSRFFGVDYQPPQVFSVPELPQRPPNLCAGCPHRATYYSVKKVFGQEAIYPSDIGCYTLGLLPPLRMADFLICMGSSVSTAGGFSKVLDRPVVAFIGDSTFFHGGLPGLVNAVSHDHRILLVILDNGTTAMTGHQPHPGVELTPQGKVEPKVNIEAVVRGFGIRKIATVNPLQVKKTQETLQQMRDGLSTPGVSVLISKSPCPLFENRMLRKTQKVVFEVDSSCDLCKSCLEELGCPAFVWEGAGEPQECIQINPALCSGCTVCAQVCKSIKPRRIDQAGGSQ